MTDAQLHTPEAVRDYLAARAALFRAFEADHRNGVSGNRIADMAAPAYSRPVLQQYFATLKLREDAHEALKAADLLRVVDVQVTGPVGQGSRRAYVMLARDPAEFGSTQALTDLIGCVLDTLAGAGITTTAPPEGYATVVDAIADGEEVTVRRA